MLKKHRVCDKDLIIQGACGQLLVSNCYLLGFFLYMLKNKKWLYFLFKNLQKIADFNLELDYLYMYVVYSYIKRERESLTHDSIELDIVLAAIL